MKFYDQKIVKLVREERGKGLSLRALSRKFDIPDTTISRWVRDMAGKNPAFQKARNREVQLKDFYKNIAHNFTVDKDRAKLLLSLLYWCEGSKYPGDNCIGFTNSDWSLVKTFLELLRKGMNIREEKIRCKLQVHSTHDYPEVLNFWSRLLGVPFSQFQKPTITNPTSKMKRRNYQGTCTVKYCDVEKLLQITGLFEEFSKRW